MKRTNPAPTPTTIDPQETQPQAPQEAPTDSNVWTPQRIKDHFASLGYDTFAGTPDAQIQTWIDHGLWDANRMVFLPERSRAGGGSLTIDYGRQPDFKPQDCPDGMVPVGADSSGRTSPCAPMTDFDPTTGSYMPGSGSGSSGGAAAAPVNVREGKSGELSLTGDPLTDMLITSFNTQRNALTGNENMFGWEGGRGPDDPSKAADVSGRVLQGGALWWAPTSQFGSVVGSTHAGDKSTLPSATATPSPTPSASAPPTASQPAASSPQSASSTPSPSANGPIATPDAPVPLMPFAGGSPMQDMLANNRRRGAFAQNQYPDLFT